MREVIFKNYGQEKTDQNSPADRVSRFIQHHYRHFNAASLVDAAKGYVAHLDNGGKMMITLGGAMSTAELGLSLAEMIRQDKVHLITCTGANLEEDVFNLVAHDYYERVPGYRSLTAEDEQALLNRHMNRVTDTCIPEGEAMRRMEKAMLEVWTDADKKGERYFPHEFFYKVLLSGKYEKYYQIDPKDSWMLAAAQKNLPIVVPGWEDATLGNMYAAAVIRGDVKNVHTVRTGIEYMTWLAEFYTRDGHEEEHARHVPDWRRHFRRFPDLRRADAASGFAAHQRAALGLLLPDQRFDHELRQLFRRGAERKNHLGQTRREDAEIHHRIRRHHCRAADFRARARLVNYL